MCDGVNDMLRRGQDKPWEFLGRVREGHMIPLKTECGPSESPGDMLKRHAQAPRRSAIKYGVEF